MNDSDRFSDFVRQSRNESMLNTECMLGDEAILFKAYASRMQGVIDSTYLEIPSLPKIIGGFVDNPNFNAFAGSLNGSLFVAVNSGIPRILINVLCRILADKRLLIGIGDSEMESDQHPAIPSKIQDIAGMASLKRAIVPRDEFRHIYAVHIARLIFDYLVCHELAHIINGHVGYLEAEKGLDFVREVDWIPNTAGGNLELQAMELDADCTAARQLVSSTIATSSKLEKQPSDLQSRYQQPEQFVFDLALAVSVSFRLLQDERIDLLSQANCTHPPRRWRQMQILNMMGNYFVQTLGDSYESKIETALSAAIQVAEDVFEKVTDTPQQVQGLHDAWHGDGWEYTRIVSAHWNNCVRPKVERYAFAKPKVLNFDLPDQGEMPTA